MKGQDVLFSKGKDDWRTPKALFEKLNKEFQFTLDGAADIENHLCDKWLGPGSNISEDAFKINKTPEERVFLNPPYSMVKEFINLAAEDKQNGVLTVALVPARVDTQWWLRGIVKHGDEIRFLVGRLKFGDATNSAPFPSAIVIFDGRVTGLRSFGPRVGWWDYRR